MKNNYPIYNNGLVGVIDYSKLIQMQNQQPIATIQNKSIQTKSYKQNISNKKLVKKIT